MFAKYITYVNTNEFRESHSCVCLLFEIAIHSADNKVNREIRCENRMRIYLRRRRFIRANTNIWKKKTREREENNIAPPPPHNRVYEPCSSWVISVPTIQSRYTFPNVRRPHSGRSSYRQTFHPRDAAWLKPIFLRCITLSRLATKMQLHQQTSCTRNEDSNAFRMQFNNTLILISFFLTF